MAKVISKKRHLFTFNQTNSLYYFTFLYENFL